MVTEVVQRTDRTAYAERTDSPVVNVTGPLYLFLFPIPAVCFVLAVLTDAAYAKSEFLMWLHFSEWLIAVGLAFGALAAVVLVIEFFTNRAMRAGAFGWSHFALLVISLVVELFNAFVHTIDGWSAVVPTGMILSIIGAIAAYAAAGVLVWMPITWVERREVRR